MRRGRYAKLETRKDELAITDIRNGKHGYTHFIDEENRGRRGKL